VDVVLNTDQAIVQAFGGDLLAMHLAATAFAFSAPSQTSWRTEPTSRQGHCERALDASSAA
jgi:hypothetical protein